MTRISLKQNFRQLPSVSDVLCHEEIKKLAKKYPQWLLKSKIREVIKEKRNEISGHNTKNISVSSIDDFSAAIKEKLDSINRKSLRRVINCSGVILHTNLGRAPLSFDQSETAKLLQGYNNLEYDVETGKRGSRNTHLRERLNLLCGSEDSIVVNNNAAALMLCMNTFAKGREVIVSRGEIVEIGGGFRINEIIKSSGALIREVGTTNRTRLSDYKRAVSKKTGVILKVHTSNFRIIGYSQEAKLTEVVSLKGNNFPVIYDAGSGLIVDLKDYGLSVEPTLNEILKTKVDLVTFSGDKLLGGPQCGIIAGRKALINRLSKNPMFRALRVCKVTTAMLEATIAQYFSVDTWGKLPIFTMITRSLSDLERQAEMLSKDLAAIDSSKLFHVTIEEGESYIGGGSYPGSGLPTRVIALSSKHSAAKVEKLFRMYDTPVIVRTQNNKLLIDVRTILENEFQIIKDAFAFVREKLKSKEL